MDQVSIERWMDKQNVVCSYDGILFRLKQERNPDAGCTLSEPGGRVLGQTSQSHKDRYCMSPLA